MLNNLGRWQPVLQGTSGNLGGSQPGVQGMNEGMSGYPGGWQPGTEGMGGNLAGWQLGVEGMGGNPGGWQPGVEGMGGHPDDWHPETHGWLVGWQPGVEGMSGYPNDWYNSNGNIPCPARDCYMVFDSSNIHNLASHWNDIQNPALSKLTNAEHYILYVMLNQGSCPFCGLATAGGKSLYSHEKERHQSSLLSNLEAFISLVRHVSPLRGHQEWAYQAIFQRLGLSITNDIALRRDLERRASYEPGYLPGTGIGVILSPPRNRPGGPMAPIKTPIPADDFLKHLAPTAAYLEHADPSWVYTWQDLRIRYASGKI